MGAISTTTCSGIGLATTCSPRLLMAPMASQSTPRWPEMPCFTDKDFLDLPAFAARLRPSPDQDPISKFLHYNLSPETRQLLTANGNDDALRKSLVKDLNVILDRELETERHLAELQREKSI